MDHPQYDPQSPLTPLSPAELDGLDRLLQGLSEHGAMTLDGLDGYLSALVVGPPGVLQTLASGEWLPLVWGGDDDPGDPTPFASKRQRKATVVLVLRHLRHLDHQLRAAPQDWEPIFSVAERGADEFVDARDWCTGFLQAVDLLPSAWDGCWDDPATAPLLALGGGLDGVALPAGAGVDPDGDLDDPAACDALSRAVPDAVLGLRARHAGAVGAPASNPVPT